MFILRVALYVAQMTSLSQLHRRLHVCACVQVGRRNPNCARASFFLSVRVCVCVLSTFGGAKIGLGCVGLLCRLMCYGENRWNREAALLQRRCLMSRHQRNPVVTQRFGNCVFVEFPL